MDVIGGIITAGVAVIAIAIITNVAGTTIMNVPAFGGLGGGFGTTNQYYLTQQWNNTMANVSSNSISGFSLMSISPLVIAAALIISILLGVFILRR